MVALYGNDMNAAVGAVLEQMAETDVSVEDAVAQVMKRDGAKQNEKTSKNGADRAAKYSGNWKDSSLKNAIKKFAPNIKPVLNLKKGKVIYYNPKTKVQVVYDTKGNYFRIEDTTRPRGRNYLDLEGNDMNNKIVNGKQMGRSKKEYQMATHFNNID